jgi:hypothetical protein
MAAMNAKRIPNEISEDITRLQTLQNALGHVEDKLSGMMATYDRRSEMSRIDKAKLDVSLAYSLSSLTYILLKTKGIPTESHEIMEQLKNVGNVFKRVKTSASGEKPVEESQKVRVDVAAGERIIKHALATNESLDSQPAPFGGKKNKSEGESSGSKIKRSKK